MNVETLITGITQLVSAQGPGARHGAAMSVVACIENAAMAIDRGRFVWVGKAQDWRGQAASTIDLGGRAVVPGLVDPHTHAVWAGDRLGDFALRTSGASYEQILAGGGGIRSTIGATQSATQEQLVALALPRLLALMESGATVIEVKSGYGFTPSAEIKMLEVIRLLQAKLPAKLVPTLLIHIPPPEANKRISYLDQIIHELIPEVANTALASAVDIFVEREAWRPDEAEKVLSCALSHGLAIKMHAEQFHAIGGLELAVELGALSVDHLEACRPMQYSQLAESATMATLLPGVSLHLGIPSAPGRGLIDAGTAVAVGTDLNPGSSPLFSVSTALALAVRLNGLSAEEALVAGTVNAAAALGLENAGRIEVGLPADFAVLKGRDWRELVYLLGANPVGEVWISGMKAAPNAARIEGPE
ncbi:MAG: imidazolonepropionase [Acidobacteriota bacterium]|nr:imidazolonepropionase [Acidobacteriota bacterium]